jgi:2-C-methyl-D-erythritol 2,4-cyclodiphosphate synthase
MLGGVEIQSDVGLLGHSDGDALLHAVCDALLGACGLGDIGDHFSDTDDRFAGLNSSFFLHRVAGLVGRRGFRIGNVDTIVFLERPKLGPYKHAMRDKIAEILGVSPGCVNVKAKTMERLGPIGSRRAIAVLVLAAVKKRRHDSRAGRRAIGC